MCHDDDWVNLAVADDSLVVNLLLRLHHTPPPLPPPPLSLHLHWTVRQRRSRSVRRHAAAASHKKQDSTRASPTTPLSWSGATSASGGNLDGYEESSRPTSLPQTSRSKDDKCQLRHHRQSLNTRRASVLMSNNKIVNGKRQKSKVGMPLFFRERKVKRVNKRGWWHSGALNATNDYSYFGSSHTKIDGDHMVTKSVSNPSETATTRKSRRKKTLAELKDEEDLLLKERRSLKKELASLRLTVEKHRTTNESLKRMKLDFVSRQNSSAAAAASEVCGKAVSDPSQFATSECHSSNSVSRNTATHDVSPVCAANASPKAQENGNQESTFVLPDLNLPVDESFSADAMH
ncbi:uncharacterized protein HKW66_Vig0211540 [Vigna angularis]|uniref:BZIP domain-containing protein n=1 Tax=Phaseolus angularis TaxID=3914 RepID=A0A8T0JFI6_PHAAN|nr:uncharacterized protein HKW66_Vig0211540 [Vigna angularis]